MKSIMIRLETIEDVKAFVSIMAQFKGYFDLASVAGSSTARTINKMYIIVETL